MQKWLKNLQKRKMMKNNLLPIVKEGLSYIIYAIVAYTFFAIFDLEVLEFIAFLATISLIFVFRNPEREVSLFEENSVVSPVDGVVLAISEIEGEYAYRVEIDSSCLNVSILRVPMISSLKSIKLKKGARLSKFSSLAKKINENAELIFEDKNSHKLKVSHMLKQSFLGMEISLKESQNLLQGSRYGVMVSGVTTLYLPQNFRLSINLGSEVKASQSLIGYFS